ncbi:MAG: hypothetical protein JXA67_20840 [Micromonosporaceae bacterium]|nr:hypothetical protein [Micromonosporaceae bacterium]
MPQAPIATATAGTTQGDPDHRSLAQGSSTMESRARQDLAAGVALSPPGRSQGDIAGKDCEGPRTIRVCAPVTPRGWISPGWGRAGQLAVVDVAAGMITSWQEFAVGWGDIHDEGTTGAHHAKIVRFLREHHVEVVIARNMGDSMRTTLGKMGLIVRLGAVGDARAAVLAAARSISTEG